MLIDVREKVERDINGIPGSVLIPKGDFQTGEALGELPQDKQVVLYCKTGVRSAEVLAIVHGAGLADAVHVGGGVSAWVNQIDPTPARVLMDLLRARAVDVGRRVASASEERASTGSLAQSVRRRGSHAYDVPARSRRPRPSLPAQTRHDTKPPVPIAYGGFVRVRGEDQIAWTWSACGPFGPWVVWNSTR